MNDLNTYDLRPIVMEAATAHRDAVVTYRDDGTALFHHPRLATVGLPETLAIPPRRQYSAIRATFDDLNKALSRLASSPRIDGIHTLRELYDAELERYEALSSQAYENGEWEPDYGSYVLDHRTEELYLVAPEFWHRLALTTSNSKLITDPDRALCWQEVRERLEDVVVGFAGLSVGGNLLEGWLREARPRMVKVADPDWVELTNFNRGERMSLRHLVACRGARYDARNPYDTPRIPKVEQVAYEQNMVDPYLGFIAYKEPLSPNNIERFLLGDGAEQPPVQVLVEEVDDLDVKIQLRQTARQHGIDVLMLTDYGHRVQTLWNPFADARDATLGAGGTDAEVLEALEATRYGDRAKVFEFSDKLCKFDYAGDPFELFVEGSGEQPTSSLPQSGATTMIAGGIGGKELALHVLGHRREATTRGCVYDFLGRSCWRTPQRPLDRAARKGD